MKKRLKELERSKVCRCLLATQGAIYVSKFFVILYLMAIFKTILNDVNGGI